MLETLANTAAEASFRIPIAWALTGFLTLCGAVAGMGKLIFSMCMIRIKALEKDVARLSRGCGVPACIWRAHHSPDTDPES
jgi:hypothetical protein